MIINGKPFPLREKTPLATVLTEAGYERLNTLAVELNGKVVKRDDRETTFVQPDDVLEVVRFVGGG